MDASAGSGESANKLLEVLPSRYMSIGCNFRLYGRSFCDQGQSQLSPDENGHTKYVERRGQNSTLCRAPWRIAYQLNAEEVAAKQKDASPPAPTWGCVRHGVRQAAPPPSGRVVPDKQ